jgi:hypothetical protein
MNAGDVLTIETPEGRDMIRSVTSLFVINYNQKGYLP